MNPEYGHSHCNPEDVVDEEKYSST